MYPEDDDEALPLPTLPKWPFCLGDAVLVGLAVTIATLDNWQLGGVQVFACVLAVALGAALLVLPFVTEFLMFAREEKEDRAAELRLFKKQLESLESALLKQHERLKKQESRLGLDDQRYELLTSAIDQKTQVELPDLTALIKRIEAIETSGTRETKVSDSLQKGLSTLGESVKQAVDSLDELQSRVKTLESKDQKLGANVPIEEKTEATTKAAVAEKSLKKKEASLLKRAIQEKQDQASSAVSRIIDSESKPTVSDSEMDQLPDDFSVSLGADLMMDDDLFEPEVVAKPKKSTAGKTKKKTASNGKAIGTTPEKPVTTIVTVNKMMGIGNKPFLRGSGAGLSWEKGVEMEFQEIGQWTWSAAMSTAEALEVQVYCNDEDGDRKGKHTLEPGQRLEIVPEF